MEFSVLFHSEATFSVQVEADSADEAEQLCEYGLHGPGVAAARLQSAAARVGSTMPSNSQ